MSDHKHLYIKNGSSYTDLKLLLTENFSKHYAGFFTITYLDEACYYDEDRPRRRSFDDLLVVARTYFPETTEEQLAETLTQIEGMRALFCPDIQKVVFVMDNRPCSFSIDGTSSRIDIKGNSAYSAADIYKLAGLPIK